MRFCEEIMKFISFNVLWMWLEFNGIILKNYGIVEILV